MENSGTYTGLNSVRRGGGVERVSGFEVYGGGCNFWGAGLPSSPTCLFISLILIIDLFKGCNKWRKRNEDWR